jgi:hypothetical protein
MTDSGIALALALVGTGVSVLGMFGSVATVVWKTGVLSAEMRASNATLATRLDRMEAKTDAHDTMRTELAAMNARLTSEIAAVGARMSVMEAQRSWQTHPGE